MDITIYEKVEIVVSYIFTKKLKLKYEKGYQKLMDFLNSLYQNFDTNNKVFFQ